jgi:hypothetical protein
MRLQLLRSKVKTEAIIVEENDTMASLEAEKDPMHERFDLFVQDDSKHLPKKTETQKIVEEREKLFKPISFSDVNISRSWYLKRAADNGFKKQSQADDPMTSFRRASSLEKCRVPYSENPKKAALKQIEDLKKEREFREKREKEKAAKLLNSIRH